jgi:uncharacterized cofD-like protein
LSGPKVVAVGGGHGLAASIAAARRYAGSLVAIASVADDGGSSGRLRRMLRTVPPGDLRKCLVAMGDPASVWSEAFEYRFDEGELDGHALGNLVLAGLAEVTGDYLRALDEAGRLLGCVGRVLPATSEPAVLRADAGGAKVEGQVAVAGTGRITRVSVEPPGAQPPGAALEALASADQVVIGPGSLYTSILAVVAVPALGVALRRTPGRKVYVCNLAAQVPETAGYTVADHVEALAAHGLEVDVVVCDTTFMELGRPKKEYLDRPLGGPQKGSHDPDKLASVLAELVG